MAFQEEQKSSLVGLLKMKTDKEDSLRIILRSIEEIFDLSYIFSHPQLKAEIDKSKNGFVKWKFIFSMTKFENILTDYGLNLRKQDESLAGILIHNILKKYSKKLRSNPGGVRRIGFFDCGEIKYLLARNYPRFSEFKQLLSFQTSITNIEEDKYQNWAIISTSNPEQILQKYNGYVWRVKEGCDCTGDEEEQLILRVYSHSDYLRFEQHQKECWSDHRFRSLYRQREIKQYPCYRDYMKKRYKDEISPKEMAENAIYGMEEEL